MEYMAGSDDWRIKTMEYRPSEMVLERGRREEEERKKRRS